MIKRIISFASGSIVMLFPTILFAQNNLQDANDRLRGLGARAGFSQQDLPTVAGTVISTALTLVGLIFLILMVYAGYLWMTARGDEGQVEKALGIVKTCVIGLIVVMSAYAITFFVLSRFGTTT
jgi:hypothetical protein